MCLLVGREEIKAIEYSDLREHPEFKGKEGMKLLFKDNEGSIG